MQHFKISIMCVCNILKYQSCVYLSQRTAAQTKTACHPVKDWRPQLPQRRPPKCPIRRSGSALFSQRRGVLAEQLENIFTDFLQYFGTSLCPCWDNGKWKCVIRAYPPLIFELGWFLCCQMSHENICEDFHRTLFGELHQWKDILATVSHI